MSYIISFKLHTKQFGLCLNAFRLIIYFYFIVTIYLHHTRYRRYLYGLSMYHSHNTFGCRFSTIFHHDYTLVFINVCLIHTINSMHTHYNNNYDFNSKRPAPLNSHSLSKNPGSAPTVYHRCTEIILERRKASPKVFTVEQNT